MVRKANMSKRIENLIEYVEAQRNKPFVIGSHDCATFAMGALDSMGVKYDRSKYPNYSTEAGAAKAIKKLGGMESIVCSWLGEPLDSPLFAQRGDIGLSKSGGLVVCLGDFYGPGPDGLTSIPATETVKAWRCPS